MSNKLHTNFLQAFFPGRFLFLLISILSLIVLTPLLKEFIGIKVLMDIFVTAVLISGIYSASPKRYIMLIAIFLALPVLVSRCSSYFLDIPSLILLGDCFGILFFAFLVITALILVSQAREVNTNVLYGAIVGYLLIALMWAFIFKVLEGVQPGSFEMAQNQFKANSLIFTYYSFVTITTLGFGDITPLSETARAFSLLEAVIGQIYLVVLVARLVGMHISQTMESRPK